jgi:putative FmdB family regulatory protein
VAWSTPVSDFSFSVGAVSCIACQTRPRGTRGCSSWDRWCRLANMRLLGCNFRGLETGYFVRNRTHIFLLGSYPGGLHMPIFEYVCTKCEHRFEALIFGNQKAACPKCLSKHLAPQLSVFAVSAKSSSGESTPTSGGCGSCGDPRGPGACSMPDFD